MTKRTKTNLKTEVQRTSSGLSLVHVPTAELVVPEKEENKYSFKKILAEGTKAVTDVGLGYTLTTAATLLMPPGVGLLAKILIHAGSLVLGGMLLEQKDNYIDRTLDRTEQELKEIWEDDE